MVELVASLSKPLSTYYCILNLLRSGALEQAEREYFRLSLDEDKSDEDIMALGGRIFKEKALECQGAERHRLALLSAEKYGEAYRLTEGTFSGINTAALYLVAGENEKARSIAKEILKALRQTNPSPGTPAYYHIATAAEAELILGNYDRARQVFEDAVLLDPHNYEVHARTLRQFEMILEAREKDQEWLLPFRPPKTLYYAGHMFGAGKGEVALDSSAFYALEKGVNDWLDSERFSAAYGALAAGSDILIAERVLAYGIDLHVVLPCSDKLFSKISLKPFGVEWQKRFDACIAKAASVRYVSKDTSMADELTAAFASETATGLAVLHAERLATNAAQLLIWDGKASDHAGGTAKDAELWRQTGRQQMVVPYCFKRARAVSGEPWHESSRSLKAMLFADVRGFGKLTEVQVPLFIDHVLAPLAASCKHLKKALKHLNTWGDGLFLVFDSVGDAAKAAVELQASFQSIDLKKVGLPETMALRIGGHYGPVHSRQDPFLETMGIFGREVTVAARIEPKTAPGSIFVSEPFACALAAQGHAAFRCEPVGEAVETKDQGALVLFSLRKVDITGSGG